MASLIDDIKEFLFPRHCSICGKRLHTGEKSLCAACLIDLRYSPYADGKEGNVLERTLWHKIPIERAASLLVYDYESSQRELLLDLKYHNRPNIGQAIAPLMVERLNSTRFFDGIDVLLPIPISRQRQIHRRYNQSECIARSISRLTDIPVDTQSVRRKNYKTSQTKLAIHQRYQNVKDTFVLQAAPTSPKEPLKFTNGQTPPQQTDRTATQAPQFEPPYNKLTPLCHHPLEGKHILLIDDVITTTSTIMSCAQALLQIPNIKISVLSLAVSHNLLRNIAASNPDNTIHSHNTDNVDENRNPDIADESHNFDFSEEGELQ